MSFTKKVLALQKGMGIDFLLITNPADVFYYTGFYPEDTVFLVVGKKGRPQLFVSSLNNEAEKKAQAEVSCFREVKEVVKELNGKVGYDDSHVTADLLPFFRNKCTLIPSQEVIKKQRMVKDAQELTSIKKAITMTTNTIDGIVPYGKRERDIAAAIEIGFLKKGLGKAFTPIVASGTNTQFIHHVPTQRTVRRKDFVIIDAGCKYNYYCSDITRTFYPTTKKELAENIQTIQHELADMIAPGVAFSEVQASYEKLMGKKNYPVMHAFGHGVGLDVHERPSKKDVFERGMVITIEPGVYFKNMGYRIEDMFVIKNKAQKLC